MSHAEQVLGYDAIRQRLASACQTEGALNLALALAPVFSADRVWEALDATREAHELIAAHSPPSLGACRDLTLVWERAAKGGTSGGQELYDTGSAMAAMRSFRQFLSPKRNDSPRLWAFAEFLPDHKNIEVKLLDSLEPGGDVKDTASATLASLRAKRKAAVGKIQERIQKYLSGKTRDLLSDPIFTVRDGRYVIPVKAENRGKIAGVVHDVSGSGQTLFVEPADVLQEANRLREIEAAENEECARILAELSVLVGRVAPDLIAGLSAAVQLDLLLAKARMAFAMHACLPERKDRPGILIEGGRHPILEQTIGDELVPLDLEVGFTHSALLITGPNTGGKTISLKTAGLFVLMAQSGLYLPARFVRLGVFSQVWADIGDEQSIEQSLSTFSGHVKNIAEAVRGCREGALVLFDEIGAGTDPAEGAALAKAILANLVSKKAIIIASTHYGELKAFAYETEGFTNAAMEFDPKSLRPTYKLIMGAPGASHALRVAERFGIPKPIIEASMENLDTGTKDLNRVLQQLEIAQRQARTAQSEADKRAAEIKRLEDRTERKLAEADEIRRTANQKAQEAIEATLREIRLEAASLFEELKNIGDTKAKEAIRAKLKDLQEVGTELAAEFQSPTTKPETEGPIVKGASVRAEGYSQIGVVMSDPKGGKAEVQMGAMKMTLAVSTLRVVQAELPKQRSSTANLSFQKAQTASTEIHIRAMRAEEAQDVIQRFLDDAVLAGLHQVRIVHGKGEGILRSLTRTALRKHPQVASFRDGEPGEGGHGATIAVLK